MQERDRRKPVFHFPIVSHLIHLVRDPCCNVLSPSFPLIPLIPYDRSRSRGCKQARANIRRSIRMEAKQQLDMQTRRGKNN